MAKLCGYCREMHLDAITRPKKNYRLGTRRQMKARVDNNECPFCVFIWRFMSYESYAWDARIGIRWSSEGFFIEPATLVFLTPSGAISNVALTSSFDFLYIAPIVSSIGDKFGISKRTTVCRSVEETIDTKMMYEWYNSCNQDRTPNRDHKNCQQGHIWDSSHSSPEVLRLFDVEDNCITSFHHHIKIERDSVPPYAALSYVIGWPTPKTIPIFHEEDSSKLRTKDSIDPRKLPKTYCDAISVVQALELRYLWIDAVCLFEGKDKDKGLPHMDRIYEGSKLTIVAADGKDADAGLGSYNPTRVSNDPSLQYSAYIPEVNMTWTATKMFFDHLKDSKYGTRGWCYQEMLLSHRSMIFAGNLTFFVCRARISFEDRWSYTRNKQKDDLYYSDTFLPDPIYCPAMTYIDTLVKYRTHDLSKPDEDVISAYHGVLNRVCDAMNSSWIVGLPEKIFDRALIWYHKPSDQLPEKGPPMRTESQFPTWTWAGWKNDKIIYFGQLARKKALNSWQRKQAGKMEFWCTDTNGQNLRLIDTGAGNRHKPPQPAYPSGIARHFLQFRTRVMKPEGYTYMPPVSRIIPQPPVAAELWGMNSTLAGMVYPDGEYMDQSLHEYEFAMLARAPNGDMNFDEKFQDSEEESLVGDDENSSESSDANSESSSNDYSGDEDSNDSDEDSNDESADDSEDSNHGSNDNNDDGSGTDDPWVDESDDNSDDSDDTGKDTGEPRMSAEDVDLRWLMMLKKQDGYYVRVGMGWILESLIDQFNWEEKWIAVG